MYRCISPLCAIIQARHFVRHCARHYAHAHIALTMFHFLKHTPDHCHRKHTPDHCHRSTACVRKLGRGAGSRGGHWGALLHLPWSWSPPRFGVHREVADDSRPLRRRQLRGTVQELLVVVASDAAPRIDIFELRQIDMSTGHMEGLFACRAVNHFHGLNIA